MQHFIFFNWNCLIVSCKYFISLLFACLVCQLQRDVCLISSGILYSGLLAVLRSSQESCLLRASVLVSSATWNALTSLCPWLSPSFYSGCLIKKPYLHHNLNHTHPCPSTSCPLAFSYFYFSFWAMIKSWHIKYMFFTIFFIQDGLFIKSRNSDVFIVISSALKRKPGVKQMLSKHLF